MAWVQRAGLESRFKIRTLTCTRMGTLPSRKAIDSESDYEPSDDSTHHVTTPGMDSTETHSIQCIRR